MPASRFVVLVACSGRSWGRSDGVGQAGDVSWLAGGAGEEGGDDVGGVAVEGDSASVVAHGGAGVGVAGGFLDVA